MAILKNLKSEAAEIERLTKRLGKAMQDLAKTRAKLASETFVRNAPEAVVKTERERETEQVRTVAGLETQLDDMRKLGP